jgi:phosphatidylglycerol:prolipoprotein diacylglycerol transferase
MAQIISIVGICLGVAGLIWLYLFNRNLPDVLTSNPEEKVDFDG